MYVLYAGFAGRADKRVGNRIKGDKLSLTPHRDKVTLSKHGDGEGR